jgi:hypothetical protein
MSGTSEPIRDFIYWKKDSSMSFRQMSLILPPFNLFSKANALSKPRSVIATGLVAFSRKISLGQKKGPF